MALTRGHLIVLLGALLAAAPPVRHIRFRVFTPGVDAPFGYVDASASPDFAGTSAQSGSGARRAIPLRFVPTAFSEEYVLRGADSATLVDAAGRDLGNIRFPESGDYFTVILLPAGEGYRAQVLDGSETNRPAGSISILNLSGTRPTGEIRSKSMTLEPGLNGPFAVGTAARIVLRVRVRDRDLQIFGENLSLPSGERGLLILLPPFREGSLEPQWRYLMEHPGHGGNSDPAIR